MPGHANRTTTPIGCMIPFIDTPFSEGVPSTPIPFTTYSYALVSKLTRMYGIISTGKKVSFFMVVPLLAENAWF